MSRTKTSIAQIIRRKELLLVLIFIIALICFIGWGSGYLILASWSSKYIPIAPSNILIISILSIVLILNLKFEKSLYPKIIAILIIISVILFCLFILLEYILILPSDIENVFVKNPGRLNLVPTGRMSPISALMYILICSGILGLNQKNSIALRYIGGSLSLMAFFLSSVLLTGYLYKAPLLYGGHIIPVSLPSVVCFWLFSLTLLRLTESKYYTFNLIKGNRVTLLMLKWFLPIVVIIIILEGYLDTVFSFNHINPPLTGAFILLIVIIITTFIIYRVSAIIGQRLILAEQALVESEERIRSIMENSADAIFITNQQGKYEYTNKTAQEMLGYTAEELNSMTFADISPKEKVSEYFEIFNKILSGEKTFSEIELLKKDGSFISTDLNAVLLPSGQIYGSCRDITERKKTELALKESDIKYRTIADYNYDWEFWLSNQKSFIYNSPSCERITGYSPDDFFCNPDLVTKIIYPEDLGIYETHLDVSGHDKPCNGIDYRIISPSGEIKWIHHVCQPVFDETGIIIGRRGSNSDITLRKNAENQINDLNNKLSSLNSDKDRFIAILGHDLKSPFNNLLGLSEVLKDNIQNLESHEIENLSLMINNAAKSTYSLLEEILMWARTQQGKIPFHPQKLDFEDICRDSITILNQVATGKNLTIHYHTENPVCIFADADMLKTILRNLVSNAIKFTNINGTITLKASETGGFVRISVSDNGIGITPENLSRLFDITQVLTTKGTADESGSGLGLLLCKDFVEKHGGKIWVESIVNSGSNFMFTLPQK